MAYKSQKTEEHAFRRMETALALDRLPSVVLLFGKEQFLTRWALGAIKAKYVPQGLEAVDFVRLDGATATAEDLTAHCETLPLGLKKVVCLEGVSFLSAERGDAGKQDSRMKEEDLLAAAGDMPDSCLLVITSEKADKRKKFYKDTAARNGAFEFVGLDRPLLRAFIDGRLRRAGKNASVEVLNSYMDMTAYLEKDSDYTLFQVDNDMKKLAAYCEGETVGLADLAAVVGGGLQMGVFALSDAVSRGERGEALRLLALMLADGENAHRILALLFSQLDTLYALRDLQERGFSREDMLRMTGVNEYRLRMLLGQGGRLGLRELRRMLERAYEADKHIKTGLLADYLALEMFVYGE
ncbi:MAG: DNA polymerase III subunit delta [Clostridiales Family XIII bacterium]|nr:DNA polymerase III subunit delta [Clostridiales Family XIII bacterium]